MKILNKWLAYLLSVVLALGTINPFALNTTQEEPTEPIFVSLFTVLFCFVSFINYGSIKALKKLRSIILPAFIMWLVFAFADFVYDISSANLFFILKFGVVLISFISFVLYFSKEPEMIERCLLLFAISCSLIIFLVYYNGLFGNTIIYKGRLIIYGENPNSTSSRMSIALFIFIYLFSKQKKWFARIAIGIGLLLLFMYIIQSGSRGSFMTTIIGVVIILFFSRGNMRSKIYITLLGLLLSFGILPKMMHSRDISLFQRMEGLEDSGNIRELLMKQAFVIWEDYPLIGVGANGYRQEKINRGFDVRDSHNILTSILALGGVVALVSFVILWRNLFKPTFLIKRETIMPLILNVSILLLSLKTGGVITFVFMWYTYALSYCWAIYHQNHSISVGINSIKQ